MDLFKAQLDRIQKQLSALTPSQKMLTAAMVAIMVMTLVWWGRYAGEPEMEALLPQGISQEELPHVEMALDAKGIKHTMSGDKLLVPADRKIEALAGLMYAHALPRNAKDAFDDVLKNINPFMSNSESDKIWNRGKELTLSQIISDFPDVAVAKVTIDPTREVRIGGGLEPSATVNITTRSGTKVSQQLVDAAADVVQGAQASLPRNKIKVIVDGAPRHPRLDDAAASGIFSDDQQDVIQKRELYLEEKIKNQLSYIPGLMVSVTVKLNTTRVVEEEKKYDSKNVISKEYDIHSKTLDTVGASATSSEVGVAPNTSLSVNSAGPAPAAAGPTSNSEETNTKTGVWVPETNTQRSTPAGDSTPIAAAVRVPLTYFAAIYSRENPGVKDPSEKQMHDLIQQQLPSIRRDVMMCTALKSEGDVAVDTYFDPAPVASAAPQTVSAGISMALLNGNHLREIILGVLALVSLFMVSMVVKKAGGVIPAIASAAGASSSSGPTTPVLDAGNELAGEVGSGATTLDGLELDDDAIRAQQMLEQVSSLVKENPDSAATLVKRWLNRA